MGIFVFNPIERMVKCDIQGPTVNVERLKPRRGLRTHVTDMTEEVRAALAPMVRSDGPVRHLKVLATVDSTSRWAIEDGREGLLVVALEQTGGRGRHGNTWASPVGGVYLSYAPPRQLLPARPTDLSLLASMAVATVVEETLSASGVSGHRALLKWPNDVLVGDGKVAGVLVQSRDQPMAVVGVGVNVNSTVDLEEDRTAEEWPVGPRALFEVTGRPLELPLLARALVEQLVKRVQGGLDGPAIEEYRARCHTLGRQVAFTDGPERLTGTAVDIDPEGGGLVVRLEGGEVRRVTSGEVRHVRSVKG
jgi:BirA family biotin operon repressor/biotin-[acetyl-CoA-carboxylase] ligase